MAEYYSFNSGRGNFLSSIPRVTRFLLVTNVIFFVATLINRQFMLMTFALFAPSSPFFHIWQIITYMFMHDGIWHILFNMYGLFFFGSMVERMIGERKFLFLYFMCGFGAVAMHLGVASLAGSSLLNVPMLGASGCVFGLVIAYAMLFPQSRLTLIFPPITLTAKWWALIYAGVELLTGVTGTASGVAHFAHLGGMLVGFLLLLYWKKQGNLFDRKDL